MVDIDELQRLHEAATKGPWTYDRCKRPHSRGGYSVLGPDGTRIFWENYNGDADIEGDDDDVNLVLAMRNALPALLRVARAAKACLDGSAADGWHTPLREVDVMELRAALDAPELRGTT